MYIEYFGFTSAPFSLMPNTQFYVNLPSHHECMNLLWVALQNGEGFVKVVGEVGAGKTLLSRRLLSSLDSAKVNTAYIPNPFMSAYGFYRALAKELDLSFKRDTSKHELFERINECLLMLRGNGRNVVLVVDEAQVIPRETLEAIRLLTNLETGDSKLLQVVLFGQPELDDILNQKNMRQLKQRVSFSYYLKSLNQKTTEHYINKRLLVSGYDGGDLFGRSAVAMIHKASRGMPRVINILCNKALMAAYGKGHRVVSAKHIKMALEDNELVSPLPVSKLGAVLGGLFSSVAVLTVGFSFIMYIR